ncbi:uncharacterized protein BCR38DRAFT_426046 [Pseudomassariella vexata]|uniref:WD40-repeat-containing domain protein n=1 Tax=Pseudomassariella vexata TaxID=1141098 RepID=A0A1Y2E738_9PEZI|nr:uncharacterized protein BCR38DRAFT_426046 [Pseudomassariella vexata]ORY67086.1 hypothetical protein BCR38DRAFT_426046 [Pseudomassariella vexata]
MMDQQKAHVSSIQQLALDLPPSCIEFCQAHKDYFVVGTYNLQKDENADNIKDNQDNDGDQQEKTQQPQSRNGSLIVFRLEPNNMVPVQTVRHPSAILDLHFHPEKQDVLAVVASTGDLSFFKLDPSCSDGHLTHIATHRPLGEDESVLLLSCCWHPRLANLIAITTSTFEVHVLQVDDSWNVKFSQGPLLVHSLEAWTVAFSPFLEDSLTNKGSSKGANRKDFTIYSGGDDSKLLQTTCVYNLNPNEDEASIEAPYPTISIRGHGAGVTAILPLDLKLDDDAAVVVTGSYDDYIRVFAVYEQHEGALSQRSKLLKELDLGGGVWRLKLVRLGDKGSATILASCMHAGPRVLQVGIASDGNCDIVVLDYLNEHRSMNYGSDFMPGTEGLESSLCCVSTSFYDKLMCLWNS